MCVPPTFRPKRFSNLEVLYEQSKVNSKTDRRGGSLRSATAGHRKWNDRQTPRFRDAYMKPSIARHSLEVPSAWRDRPILLILQYVHQTFLSSQIIHVSLLAIPNFFHFNDCSHVRLNPPYGSRYNKKSGIILILPEKGPLARPSDRQIRASLFTTDTLREMRFFIRLLLTIW